MNETGNLFDTAPRGKKATGDVPLPELMRPDSLEGLIGLGDLLGEGKFLRTAIENDRLPSMIFWGPPGSGKTTVARIIAKTTRSRFLALSATSAGIKDIKAEMEEARKIRNHNSQKTILFIDEIHRFNRAQQDAFLPYAESGDIILIGATTENPSFEINSALLSRSKVVVFPTLDRNDVRSILGRAILHPEVQRHRIELTDEALDVIAATSGGDARQALNTLELIVQTAVPGGEAIDVASLEQILQKRSLLYDKSGEQHYNIISALHKSIRNGDADAALYWLARMVEGGEDALYIARRLVRASAEDIGLADPEALRLAVAAKDAVHFIGMPEGGVVLAELVIYLAQAPKSNSAYAAFEDALREVRRGDNPPVPLQVRNAPTGLMKDLGFGSNYQYAHNYEEQTTPMECLPDSLAGRRFYEPKQYGQESEIAERLRRMRETRETMRAARKTPGVTETDRLHPRKGK